MFSHVTLGTNDFMRATAFYDAVFATLGIPRFYSEEGHAGYGEPRASQTWIVYPFDGKSASIGNGTHIAYLAADRGTVRAFYETALANGGSDEGAPGPRPHYHENYYAAYVRDPDGNKLQAVCHSSEAA
ncbi:VOC family protein [Nisaea sp.]|uniref:VOC family protein n=1 Tax=Nisaea sp. TaxID=2024842 RepID=UPI003262CE4A